MQRKGVVNLPLHGGHARDGYLIVWLSMSLLGGYPIRIGFKLFHVCLVLIGTLQVQQLTLGVLNSSIKP